MLLHFSTHFVLLLGAPLLLAQGDTELLPDLRSSSASTLFWADYDGDGLPDAWAVQPGGDGKLLHNAAGGSFRDVTEVAGLAEIRNVHMAAWGDADGDGRQDLYLASYDGPSRLFVQSARSVFLDVSEACGLPRHAEPIHAEWFDVDADGRPDLLLTTIYDEFVYRNLGRAQFQKLDLGLSVREADLERPRPRTVEEARLQSGLPALGSEPGTVSSSPLITCLRAIRDVSDPAACLYASSTPTLGLLHPLSIDLNVSAAGDVGIGTITPGEKLDVAGTARAERFVSTVPGGTAPMMVSSTTRVANLNADQLDGLDANAFRIAADLITLADLASGSVNSSKVVNDSLTAFDVAANAIGASELQWASVGTSHVVDNSLTVSDLGPDSVGASEMRDNSVGSAEVIDNSLTASDLATGSVGALEIATGAVAAAEVLDNSLTASDLATGSVGSAELIDYSITSVDMAEDSVYSWTIADGSIGSWDLGPSCVDTPHLFPEAVDSAAIHNGAVQNGHVALSAAIAGTKINPDFGSQNVRSTGRARFDGVSVSTIGTSHELVVYSANQETMLLLGSGPLNSRSRLNFGDEDYVYIDEPADDHMEIEADQGVTVLDDFTVTNGTKAFLQPHPTDASKAIRFVCLEGNESGTYFRGSSRILAGQAFIEVPEEFRLATDPEGITVQLTPRGAIAGLCVVSCDLETIVVAGSRDVEFDYFVNGVRRGFAGIDTIVENRSIRPRLRGVPYEADLPEAYLSILVENGILNPDYTPNEDTAARMGWKLRDPEPGELADGK